MRDRDRIMYSSAFRRLAGKTQIYLTEKGYNNSRNRLTHTLEVAQIARTISAALKLNTDLTEAIAYGHDLGHTPFGHAGERKLHEIMVPKCEFIKDTPIDDSIKDDILGFKHNIQSVRIVSDIDKSYGNLGLNLTNYTLWGIIHHTNLEYKKTSETYTEYKPSYLSCYYDKLNINGDENEAGSFEALVVACADEIAQWHHDLEDAIIGQAMNIKEVCEAILESLGGLFEKEEESLFDRLKEKESIDHEFKADVAKLVVSTLVDCIIDCSSHNLDELWREYNLDETQLEKFFRDTDWDSIRDREVIGFGRIHNGSKKTFDFQNIIKEKVHHSKDVERMNAKGQYIIKKLFQAYYKNPQQLSDSTIRGYMFDVKREESYLEGLGIGKVRSDFEEYRKSKGYDKYEKVKLMRHICDFIAGMTDGYALKEYKELYG